VLHIENNNCFAHNSCDGTDTFVRIKTFYTESGFLGENIASGQNSPQSVIAAWIVDAGVSPPGHRTNMVSSTYKVMGNGFNNNQWTQDFGGGATIQNYPIAAGTHFFLNSTHTTFMVNVYNATWVASNLAVKSVKLVMNSASYDMKVENNYFYNDNTAATCGTYSISFSNAAANCTRYSFEVVDPYNVKYTYPQVGSMITYNPSTSSTCKSFYTLSSSSASSIRAVAAPTAFTSVFALVIVLVLALLL